MGYYEFTDLDIEELKGTPYTDVFDHLGVRWKRNGKYIDYICPFHDDHHFGSAKVNIDKHFAHCYGSCSKNYSVVDFIMEMENKSFKEALITLAELNGTLWRYEKKPDLNPKPKSKYPLRLLTAEEKEALGFLNLKGTKPIIGYSSVKPDDGTPYIEEYDAMSETTGYCLLGKNMITWQSLMRDSPLEYRLMILERVFYRLKEVKNLLCTYMHIQIESDDAQISKVYDELIEETSKKFEIILKVAKSFGYDRVMKEISKAG